MATALRTWTGSVTSHPAATALPGTRGIAAAADDDDSLSSVRASAHAAAAAASTSASMTLHPSRTRAREMASPMPDPAPVTSAVLRARRSQVMDGERCLGYFFS